MHSTEHLPHAPQVTGSCPRRVFEFRRVGVIKLRTSEVSAASCQANLIQPLGTSCGAREKYSPCGSCVESDAQICFGVSAVTHPTRLVRNGRFPNFHPDRLFPRSSTYPLCSPFRCRRMRGQNAQPCPTSRRLGPDAGASARRFGACRARVRGRWRSRGAAPCSRVGRGETGGESC